MRKTKERLKGRKKRMKKMKKMKTKKRQLLWLV
jgi:hypothetical protein